MQGSDSAYSIYYLVLMEHEGIIHATKSETQNIRALKAYLQHKKRLVFMEEKLALAYLEQRFKNSQNGSRGVVVVFQIHASAIEQEQELTEMAYAPLKINDVNLVEEVKFCFYTCAANGLETTDFSLLNEYGLEAQSPLIINVERETLAQLDEYDLDEEESALYDYTAQAGFRNTFTRVVWRDPSLLTKLLTYPFLDAFPSHHDTHVKLCNWYFFRAASLPQTSKRGYACAFFLSTMARGISWVSEIFWPAAFYALLSYDLILFELNNTARFGTQPADIFSGLSQNQLSLSSHLGSDIPGEFYFFLGPGLLAGSMMVAVFTEFVLSKFELRYEDLAFSLQWDKNLTRQEQLERLHQLLVGAKSAFLPAKLSALTGLARVADSFQQDRLTLFGERRSFAYLGQSALNRIIEEGAQFSLLQMSSYLYANYLLWTLGRSPSRCASISFWTFALLQKVLVIYSQLRLTELLIIKLIQGIEYFLGQDDCKNTENVWSYIEQFGDYFCSVCGDWPFVPAMDIFNPQLCLDALLAVPRDPSQLRAWSVSRVLRRSGVERIDLSQQPLSNWTLSEWEYFLEALGTQIELKIFNLSRATFNPHPWKPEIIELLIDFFAETAVATLDLSNQGLGVSHIEALILEAQNVSFTELNLSGNYLDDQGINLLLLKNSTKSLNLARNAISNHGARIIFEALRAGMPLENIDLSSNVITGDLVPIIASYLRESTLLGLSLSNNDLSEANWENFWNTSTLAYLQTLKIDNANLDDSFLIAALPYLANTRIQTLSLIQNNFSDQGILVFIAGLRNTTSIQDLDLSQNSLSKNGLKELAILLQETSLTALRLDGLSAAGADFDPLLQVLSFCRIQILSLRNNQLSDDEGLLLGWALQNSLHSWQALYLAGNQLGDVSGPVLIHGGRSANITLLELSNNHFGFETAYALAYNLSKNAINELYLAENGFSSNSAMLIAHTLPYSGTKYLDFAANPIGTEGALAFARKLINSGISKDSLGHRLSIDERRALTPASISARTWRHISIQARDIQHAIRNTSLERLLLQDVSIGAMGDRALCQVLPASGIPALQTDFAILNCVSSDGARIHSCYSYRQIESTVFYPEFDGIASFNQMQALPYLSRSSADASSGTSIFFAGLVFPGIGLLILGVFIACVLYRYFFAQVIGVNGIQQANWNESCSEKTRASSAFIFLNSKAQAESGLAPSVRFH